MITIGAIVLASAFITYYSASFTKRIKQFVDNLGFIAKGDFTRPVEVRTKDEIGKMGSYYNNVLEELKHIVNTISENSKNIAGMTEELSEGTKMAANTSERFKNG